jgi:uncharacterized membrane protein
MLNINAAQIHLLLNHFPVLLPVVGAFLLLVGILFKLDWLKETAAWVFVLAALFAIPTFLSGEPAEEIVEKIQGVSRELIHEHEEMAEAALVAVEALGLSSLILVLGARFKKSFAALPALWLMLLGLSIVTCGLMGWTAHLGGVIRHEEIRAKT